MSIVNYSTFGKTTKKRKRVARGYSGCGGSTGGRGDKGQKARSGVSGIRFFEGGQTPIYRTLPIRGGGFGCYKRDDLVAICIAKLAEFAAKHKISKIDTESLVKYGMIKANTKFKVIGAFKEKISFDVECDAISKGAMSLFEKSGHKVLVKKSVSN